MGDEARIPEHRDGALDYLETALNVNRDDAAKALDAMLDAAQHKPATTIKAIEGQPGRVGGYLVVWGSPQQRDLQGEYFTPQTDLGLDWYEQRPALYHHGLDDTMKAEVIGAIVSLKMDDTGLWAEAQLDVRKRYVQAVMQLVNRGALGWSSGSLPHLVDVTSDGEIKRWPIVEGSMTPSPAEPRHTDIHAIKSAYAELGLDLTRLQLPDSDKDDAPSEEPPAKENAAKTAGAVDPDQSTTRTFKMNMQTIVQQVLDGLLTARPDWQVSPEERAALIQQILSSMSAPAEQPVEDGMMAVALDNAAAKTMTALTAHFTAKAQKAAAHQTMLNDALKAAIATVPPTPVPQFTGGGQPDSNRGTGFNGVPMPVSNLRLRSKFANLAPEDQSFIVDTYGQYAVKTARRPVDVIFSKEQDKEAAVKTFMLELADKVTESYSKGKLYMPDHGAEAAFAIKSMAAVKANELDHTTQTNYGQEWVAEIWRNQIWDKARLENVVLQQFESTEMMAKVEDLPLESDDPDVHFVPEDTDDADLDPSASPTPAGKVKTGKAQFNAKKLKLRVGWSAEEDEDSIIRFADQARKQSDRAVRNAIDFNLLNGDTESGTTNINKDGAAPTATDKYMAFDGLLKMALVTGSGLKIDAGGAAPSLALIRQTRFSMGREQAPNVDDIVLFTHTEGYSPMLGIDEFLTQAEAGPLATAQKGQLGIVDGMPVLVTAQMLMSASNGKVSNTGANNILSRILVVYKPNWKVGFRRQIRAVVVALDGEDAFQLHISTRLDFKSSTQDSAAVLYDLGS